MSGRQALVLCALAVGGCSKSKREPEPVAGVTSASAPPNAGLAAPQAAAAKALPGFANLGLVTPEKLSVRFAP